MQATRILPDLQASLLCEEVRQESNGNFFLIGVVNFIRVPQLPVVAGRLCVFNRWTAGLGQFTEKIRLIAPDQTTDAAASSATMVCTSRSRPSFARANAATPRGVSGSQAKVGAATFIQHEIPLVLALVLAIKSKKRGRGRGTRDENDFENQAFFSSGGFCRFWAGGGEWMTATG